MSTDSPIQPQRFDAVPYRPDGGVPFRGLVLTVLISIAAALVIAGVVSFIHQWFYLLALFPIGMGAGVGVAGLGGIKVGKVRSPLLAGGVALFAGALVMVASYYGDYLLALRAIDRQAPGLPGLLDGLTFPLFLDLRAEQGVTITRLGGAGRGSNLGYVGSYIYWLAEIGIAAGMAWYVMKGSAAEPFCSACQAWKQSEVVGGTSASKEIIREIMDEGDLPRLVQPGLVPGDPVLFTAHVCQYCGEQGTVEVSVKAITINTKGEKETEIGTWSFAGEALPAWRNVFAAPIS